MDQWRDRCPACNHALFVIKANGAVFTEPSRLRPDGFEVPEEACIEDDCSTCDEVIKCIGCQRLFRLDELVAPERTFKFDLGDSTDGPIGMVIRVKAQTAEDAAKEARDYIGGVYINPATITAEDAEEE